VNGQRLAGVLIAGAVLGFLAGSGVAIRVLLGTGPSPVADDSADALGEYGPVPEFSLLEPSGRRVTLADLRGTVWVTSFIYTECTEKCPLQSLQLSRLQDEFCALTGFAACLHHGGP